MLIGFLTMINSNSISGYVFALSGETVSWELEKQTCPNIEFGFIVMEMASNEVD